MTAISAGLGLLMQLGRERPPATTLAGTLSVAQALAATGMEGFERAVAPRRFIFPADHGPHPTFQTEWWYWTGNVRASGPGGAPRRFGFQLTFFRTALAPPVVPRRS